MKHIKISAIRCNISVPFDFFRHFAPPIVKAAERLLLDIEVADFARRFGTARGGESALLVTGGSTATVNAGAINLLSDASGGTAGTLLNLVVQQDETANFHGQTIVVPQVFFIYSDTDVPSCGV